MEEQQKKNIRQLIEERKKKKTFRDYFEKSIPSLLFVIASISVLTTIGIVITLLTETVEFFKRVPIVEFVTGTVLKPLSQNPEFGVLPLVMGTMLSSLISLFVAVRIGLIGALYLRG